MRAGKLRHRITVKYKADLQTDSGAEVEQYNELFKAKANVRIMSGSELVKYGASLNIEIATVMMRYNEKLDYEHFIEFNDVLYDVNSIKPDDKMREMIVTVSREL